MVELRYGSIVNGVRTYETPKSFFVVHKTKKQEVIRETGTDLAQKPYEIIKGVKTVYEIELGVESWYGTNERYFLLNFEMAQLKQMKIDGNWIDVFLRKFEWRDERGIKVCWMELEVIE